MKNGFAPNTNSSPPRGILRDSKGVGITIVGLPMADHFFQATSYRIKKIGSNLHMVFGSQTAFPDDSDREYRLAIEIVYPLEMAAKYIYQLNWKGKSAGGPDSFAKVLGKAVEKNLATYEVPKIYKIPEGSNFRSFPANFSIMSFSTGQGSIEFFLAPPGTVVEALFQKSGWRPNSDVRAVLTVLLSPEELYRFLDETRALLEQIPVRLEDLED